MLLTHTTVSKSLPPPTCQRDQLQFMPSLQSLLMLQSLPTTLIGESQPMHHWPSQRHQKFLPLNTLTSPPTLKPRPDYTTTTNVQHTVQSTHPKFNTKRPSTSLLTNVPSKDYQPTHWSITHNWHGKTTIMPLPQPLQSTATTTGPINQHQHQLTESQSTQPKLPMPKPLILL